MVTCVIQVRALTEEQHAMGQELSLARGGRQSAEAALLAERERALQLETEKVGMPVPLGEARVGMKGRRRHRCMLLCTYHVGSIVG
eukprot:1158017-Pelagomonas_calceolata.AAC.7